MDDMVSEIQKFCEMYEGTAIGEETKHRLDNAEGNEEAIENIFMALKEDGYSKEKSLLTSYSIFLIFQKAIQNLYMDCFLGELQLLHG